MVDRSDLFLDLYRQLEEELNQRTQKQSGSVIVDFMNSSEGKCFKEDLDAAREVRNLLSHHAERKGESIVEPSKSLIECLEKVLEQVRYPLKAKDIATPAEKLLSAHLNQNVMYIMSQMKEKGISHIPVLYQGKFYGVFSMRTVFDYLLKSPEKPISETTLFGDIRELLALEQHPERFLFVKPDTSFKKIHDLFERSKEQADHRRVSGIFLTENGQPDGELQGIITVWDVIKNIGRMVG